MREYGPVVAGALVITAGIGWWALSKANDPDPAASKAQHAIHAIRQNDPADAGMISGWTFYPASSASAKVAIIAGTSQSGGRRMCAALPRGSDVVIVDRSQALLTVCQ